LAEAPSATRARRERTRIRWSAAVAATYRTDVRLAALWLALGCCLALITSRVADWYVMTDELFYERLAISVAHSYSPLPHVHGELIGNINQLYPLLLAPLFDGALVPQALLHAHVLNAFVMTSASIPAFLLARRVTRDTRLSYVVAFLSVCVPWMTLSSFLMTEVVAYPAFLWAMLALHDAVVSPSARRDLVMVVALAVATLARTQFAVLVLVVPVALLVHQVVCAQGLPPVRRVAAAGCELVSTHLPLAIAYAGAVCVVAGLLVVHRFSGALGTYSVTAEGDLFPSGMGRSLIEHLAPLALGLGILPFILGLAWLFGTVVAARVREQNAFASIATVTILALLLEVTSYDLRFGRRTVHDRYLFYVVPLVLIAFAALLRSTRWPRWSLLAPSALVGVAFALAPVVRFDKLNVDSPVAALNGALLDLGGSMNGARLALVFLTIVAVSLVILLSNVLRRRHLPALLLVIACIAIPAQTALAFTKLLTRNGTSGRPITLHQGGVFNWIDRELGTNAKVTMIPYPLLYNAYWADVAYWWNVEFWNVSVERAAVYQDAFTGTPPSFPQIRLSFDRTTGRANVSPSDYSAQGIAETRFHLAGTVRGEYRGVTLIRNAQPWRADWLAFDLYRDGWTIPRVRGTIRVFAAPGQTGARMRYLTISVRAPQNVPARSFDVVSNSADWKGTAGVQGTSNQISVCVPANRFADVHISTRHFSPIYGDPRSEESFFSYARSGGVLVTGIALADETRAC
jgi:hypothetical protein